MCLEFWNSVWNVKITGVGNLIGVEKLRYWKSNAVIREWWRNNWQGTDTPTFWVKLFQHCQDLRTSPPPPNHSGFTFWDIPVDKVDIDFVLSVASTVSRLSLGRFNERPAWSCKSWALKLLSLGGGEKQERSRRATTEQLYFFPSTENGLLLSSRGKNNNSNDKIQI